MSAPEVNTDDLRAVLDPVRCPGRGNDGHGLQHCAECCFGTGFVVENEWDLELYQDLAAAADEIDRLRRWKAESIEVLAAWDEVHRALGSPARPGQSIAAASKAEAERLREQRNILAAVRNDAMWMARLARGCSWPGSMG